MAWLDWLARWSHCSCDHTRPTLWKFGGFQIRHETHKVRRSPYPEALKLWKGRSGTADPSTRPGLIERDRWLQGNLFLQLLSHKRIFDIKGWKSMLPAQNIVSFLISSGWYLTVKKCSEGFFHASFSSSKFISIVGFQLIFNGNISWHKYFF